jgi:6-phosphogluconolactonase (cycloisomerase 2 family)
MSVSVFTSLNSSNPRGLVSDGTYLYALDSNGNINKINIQTKNVSTIATLTGNNIEYGVLDIDSTYIYVLAVDTNSNSLRRITYDGVLDNSFTTSITGHSISVIDSKLYISNKHTGTISVMDIPSKSITSNWVTGLNTPAGLTFSDNNLYVLCSDSIKKIRINSNGTASLISGFADNLSFGGDPVGFTNDGTYLYAVNHNTSTISKIRLSNGSVVDNAFVSISGGYVRSLYRLNYNIFYGYDTTTSIYVINTAPSFTNIYLGNATVTNTGDFNLANTVLTSTRFPADNHELVPRAYVDNYIASVVSYYNSILDPSNSVDASGNKITVLDRVAYLEAQLERVYQAIWNVNRNVDAIVTPQLGPIVADYVVASNDNADLIANPPVAPASLSGFQ